MRLSAVIVLSPVVLGSCKEGGGGGSGTGTGTTETGTTEAGTGTTSGATTTGTGSTGAPTSSGGATDSGGETTGVVTASSSAGTASSSGASDATTTATTGEGSTGSSTTGGGSALMLGMGDAVIFANCMPIVPPDPVHATWTLFLDNSGGVAPANVAIKGVSMVFDPDGVMDAHAISVTPTQFGPIAPGEVLMAMLTKEVVPGGLPGCSHCGEKVRFDFEWEVDGGPISGSYEDTLECAF